MISLNLFFIILSLPKYIIVIFFNLFLITKEKLINFKNIKNFIFSKNISIFYVLFIVSLFYNNSLNYEFIVQNQFYIILLSLIFYFNFTKKNFQIKKFFWVLSIIYFFYVIGLVFFNNIILSCVISNNGFYDFFSIVNNEQIILNITKYNCDNYNQQGLLEHQSSFRFKIFIFLLVNSLSLILNINDKKKIYINIFFQIYLNLLVFSLSSRGLGLVLIFTDLIILFFLIIKNKKLYSMILISFFIIFSFSFYLKSFELINIFYFKKLSENQKYITIENLFQKTNLIKYQSNSLGKEYQKGYLSYNYYGQGKLSLSSDRWKEYKSFFNTFYKKYFLGESDKNFYSYYHNFYMNQFARTGFTSLFLILYLFLLNLKNFLSSLKLKKIENICLSVIYISIFSYVSIFDAFLSPDLKRLILLIIILFILNKYNERNTEKI